MERTFCAKFIESFDCINPKMLSGLLSVDYDDPVLRDYFVVGFAYLITIYPAERLIPRIGLVAQSLRSSLIPSRIRERGSQGWNLYVIRTEISIIFLKPIIMDLSHGMLPRIV